jgi:hypothetical protein
MARSRREGIEPLSAELPWCDWATLVADGEVKIEKANKPPAPLFSSRGLCTGVLQFIQWMFRIGRQFWLEIWHGQGDAESGRQTPQRSRLSARKKDEGRWTRAYDRNEGLEAPLQCGLTPSKEFFSSNQTAQHALTWAVEYHRPIFFGPKMSKIDPIV